MATNVCVVLNNQHQIRVRDFVAHCRHPDDRMLFQPYTNGHLRLLRHLDDEGKLPVPIYLVRGQYGASAVAVGDLVKVEYREDVPQSALALLRDILPETDTHIYGRNLLYLAHARRLQHPIPVERFRKVRDRRPLRRGRWPAVICYRPTKFEGPPIPPRESFDDPSEAFEGHLRLLFVRHRRREQRLRRAKIRLVLRQSGHLRCEVPACSFDFEEVYGELGRGYAQVHHLAPLAATDRPRMTPLRELRVVCANCHSMIHRGGACRSLAEVERAISEHA